MTIQYTFFGGDSWELGKENIKRKLEAVEKQNPNHSTFSRITATMIFF